MSGFLDEFGGEGSGPVAVDEPPITPEEPPPQPPAPWWGEGLKKYFDAYTGLLIIALIALFIGFVLFFVELARYDFERRPPGTASAGASSRTVVTAYGVPQEQLTTFL